jgi:hypothetical protein
MPLRPSRVAALLGLVLPLGACAVLDQVGAERMREVPTAQLCTWRGNPISGGQMRRELARRGEDCGEARPVLAAAAPAPAPTGPASPEPEPAAAPEAQPVVPREAQPVVPGEARPVTPTEVRPVTSREAQPLVPAEAPPVASAGAEPVKPMEARPVVPAEAEPVAPLVTPACAERDLRRGGEAGGEPRQRAIRFTNRCDFPIKVLYAADRSKLLSHETGLLRPGEQTGFARIEDALDLPGYVVCSYARAPASVPCRIGPERR